MQWHQWYLHWLSRTFLNCSRLHALLPKNAISTGFWTYITIITNIFCTSTGYKKRFPRVQFSPVSCVWYVFKVSFWTYSKNSNSIDKWTIKYSNYSCGCRFFHKNEKFYSIFEIYQINNEHFLIRFHIFNTFYIDWHREFPSVALYTHFTYKYTPEIVLLLLMPCLHDKIQWN